ncbi:unnamed protein product [Orchesella dallaii]|uniref:KAT8 regulatory NSL complex subunit 3 n=1 Tax=Orchesella dallaii TaxID=48710 RepID=A0ABP1RXG4_9HEXA
MELSDKDSSKAPIMDVNTSESTPMSLTLPVNVPSEKTNLKKSSTTGLSYQPHAQGTAGGEKVRIKRPYNKKRVVDGEKPPPKKRGRKSKKELSMMDVKEEDIDISLTQQSTKISRSKKSSQQKISKKASVIKAKKTTVSTLGPSVFDKKILAGPHLTMKQVLEYILTDHSYCVPPDPLPAVSSNHQMIRSILGPKNISKPRTLPIMGTMDSSNDRSPIIVSSLSRPRVQLNLSSTLPTSSKLENLLKRGDASPVGLSTSTIRFNHSRNASECRDETDIEIDIETVEQEKRVPYDVNKAIDVMKECEKYVEFARSEDTGDDWEAKILKTGWTKAQTGLFDKIVNTLHAERLARLTYERIGDAEPVLRRASIDRTASRVRRIFGEYLWDSKLTQWLHGVLTESLNYDYLAVYLDVLQTLKSRCPQLVSRMLTLSVSLPLQKAGREDELVNLLTPFLEPRHETEVLESDSNNTDGQLVATADVEHEKVTVSTNSENDSEIYLPKRSVVPQMKDVIKKLNSAKHAEALKALLERQWDPFSPVLLPRMKKLAANPVFLLIAPCAIYPKLSLNRRLRQYHDMFRRIGKIVTVTPRNFDARNCASASNYIEKIMSMAREKVRVIRSSFPDRPLYVVGWGSGSILAARLSNMVGPVDGIVALGFPLHSLKRMQEDLHKVFSGLKHPVLFMIGGLASNNSLTDMELFRRRLACETSLVVVGSGNENLYVSRAHREKLLVTQSFVDKNIMDEIAYFVNLHSKHNQVSATITTNISMKPSFTNAQRDTAFGKKYQGGPRGRKRSASTTGLDVEPPINDDKVGKLDGENVEVPSSSPKAMVLKKETDSNLKSTMNPYDYDFDEPKFIPSNKSSNKRKAYSSRPNPSTTSSSVTSSSYLTASKLLQQSPNAKRRMSKPSGPNQRAPILAQQPGLRNSATPQAADQTKDDPAAVIKYLNNPSPQEMSFNDVKQESSVGTPSLPIVLRQPDPTFQTSGGNESRILGSTYYNKDSITAPSVSTKSGKKKANTKSKAARVSKTSSTESPSVALVNALTDVSATSGSATGSTPASSLDMHKFVIQHQQMIKHLEHHRQDIPQQQTSQLFKLLSPASDSDSMSSSASSLPYASEYVKLKLIGSQPVTPSDLMTGEARTAVISKQNLVTNMALPMIRLSASKPDEVAQKPNIIMTGPSSSLLTNLSGDSGERIFIRATDKGLVHLNSSEIKNLIAGSRGIQVVSGVPGLSSQSQLNVLVKKSQNSSEQAPALLESSLAISAASSTAISAASSTISGDALSTTSLNEASATDPEINEAAAPSLDRVGIKEAPPTAPTTTNETPSTAKMDISSTISNDPSFPTVNKAISDAMNLPASSAISALCGSSTLPEASFTAPVQSHAPSSIDTLTLPSNPVLSSVTTSTYLSELQTVKQVETTGESVPVSNTSVPTPDTVSQIQPNNAESLRLPLPVSNDLVPNDSAKTLNLQSATVEGNSSKDNSNCTEDQIETEPEAVDAEDTDDEMSGLCISSTFSVCPTSGERVDPSEFTSATESQPTDSEKSSDSEKPDGYRSKLRPRRSTSLFDPY